MPDCLFLRCPIIRGGKVHYALKVPGKLGDDHVQMRGIRSDCIMYLPLQHFLLLPLRLAPRGTGVVPGIMVGVTTAGVTVGVICSGIWTSILVPADAVQVMVMAMVMVLTDMNNLAPGMVLMDRHSIVTAHHTVMPHTQRQQPRLSTDIDLNYVGPQVVK